MSENKYNFEVIIAILGLISSIGGVYINNIYVIILGFIFILIYSILYIKERFFGRIEKIEEDIKEITKDIKTNKTINKLKERIAYLEGKMNKNKKGFLDPITLIIIILIIVLIILFLKGV